VERDRNHAESWLGGELRSVWLWDRGGGRKGFRKERRDIGCRILGAREKAWQGFDLDLRRHAALEEQITSKLLPKNLEQC
jgi:hypothetical protein